MSFRRERLHTNILPGFPPSLHRARRNANHLSDSRNTHSFPKHTCCNATPNLQLGRTAFWSHPYYTNAGTKLPPAKSRWVQEIRELRTEVLHSRGRDSKTVSSVTGFRPFLLSYVLHNCFIGHITAGCYEVPASPQMPAPELLVNVMELHHQLA